MRIESQTHPQDDHRDKITDCIRPGSRGSTRVRLAKDIYQNTDLVYGEFEIQWS